MHKHSSAVPIGQNNTQETIQLLAHALNEQHWMLATAESCTAGLVAAACTDLAGSSQWFERGFVTYSNEAKVQMLGVDAQLIEQYGAVSQEVAHAMAAGALKHSNADVSISVTGIAGPGGGSAQKPVGLVWFGWGLPDQIVTEHQIFQGNRQQIRAAAKQFALEKLYALVQAHTIKN